MAVFRFAPVKSCQSFKRQTDMLNWSNYFRLVPLSLAIAACGGGGGGGGGDAPAQSQSNRAPRAESLSLRANLASPYLSAQLQGSDPDSDIVNFVLDAPPDGAGYKDAFIDSAKKTLYVTLIDNGVKEVALQFRATDGALFSEPARVTITLGDPTNGGRGAKDVPAEQYSQIKRAYFDGDRFGASGNDVTLPPSIDLSGNFPTPGNQGQQSSCVGWATAYALKSYHEKVEERWDFSSSTIFSPAWVYNQINGGNDGGSMITDALQLIIDKGASPWSFMSYSDSDYRTQPDAAAIAEAAKYKAVEYRAISSVQQIKSALANRSPVVGGIQIYIDFERLQGENSVYNSTTGNSLGGHAITLVGYDDAKFGGAFKVINSWGVNWGDQGFFWIPYDKVSDVMMQAFVLTDGPNSGTNPDVPVTPPSTGDLPDLTIVNWGIAYNGVPGGEGTWQWEVVNSGKAVAPKGADVNLMLSKDDQIDSSDWYVVYEEIGVDLKPGESVGRKADNPRSFNFPKNITPGDYYMAVWVDDLQEIEEADENNNISFGNGQAQIGGGDQSDLAIDSWWANWDEQGNGVLDYVVYNAGTAPTKRNDWDVNLVLSTSETLTADSVYYLYYREAGVQLQPNEALTSDGASPAQFNLGYDVSGNQIPPGDYYISLWVDDESLENETNEINNQSLGNQQITIEGQGANPFSAARSAGIRFTKASAPSLTQQAAKSVRESAHTHVKASQAFNGRHLPSGPVVMKRVRIAEQPNGSRTLTMLDDAPLSRTLEAGKLPVSHRLTKSLKAKDQAIFPREKHIELPAGGSDLHAK